MTGFYSVRALVVQEPEGIYIIQGTEQNEDDRGPAGIPNKGHLYCGICLSSKHMNNVMILSHEVRGYKGIEVFDTWTE